MDNGVRVLLIILELFMTSWIAYREIHTAQNMLDAFLNISFAFRPKSIHPQFRSIAPEGLADQCNPVTIPRIWHAEYP